MKTSIRTLGTTAAATLLALGLAGCSTGAVEQADVEEQVSSQFEEQLGQAPDEVSCPDDLTAEVGESIECTVTSGEEELNVSVTVDSVDGDTVNYTIESAEE